MTEFYLTLPSDSNRSEFPDNKANSFKIRLPHPLRLQGQGWKVGLTSISLPNTSALTPLSRRICETNRSNCSVLFKTRFRRLGPNEKSLLVDFDTGDLARVLVENTGVGLMKSVLTSLDQKRLVADNGPTFNASYLKSTSSGTKKTYIHFEWEGYDLVTKNQDVYIALPPKLQINVVLAKLMGWLTEDETQLGPNLSMELFQDEKVPNLRDVISFPPDFVDDQNNVVFWTVKWGFLILSIYCNWRFLNLNKPLEVLWENTSRSLFVYSDVCSSGVVGNQVTDVLREVNYGRSSGGYQYFEPLHVQYIPVRKDEMDIIEVQVAETTGELTRFDDGVTILTLHFKKS